jgi:hypothetical protein
VKTGCPPIPAARSTIIIPNDPAITPQAMSVLSTKSGGKYGLVIAANPVNSRGFGLVQRA